MRSGDLSLPSFSVIIPTFNRARLLPRAILSAIRAGGDGCQIVVVDDGSDDNTEAVASQFASRIHYLRSNHEGACAARNKGMRFADTDYIFFLDSDDEYAGDILNDLTLAASQEGLDFAVGLVANAPAFPAGAGCDEILRNFLNPVESQTAALVWRRQFLMDMGGWNERTLQMQDWELLLRSIFLGGIGRTVPSGFLIRHIDDRQGRISSTISKTKVLSMIEVIVSLRNLISNESFEQSGALARLAYRVSRTAFRSGFAEEGKRALGICRALGMECHSGGPAHRYAASLIGLRCKEYIATRLRPPNVQRIGD
jgi:glycosyltransferase involved in cell wall biosynthesis